jgi:uncharacterized protein (TIGR04442 family)
LRYVPAGTEYRQQDQQRRHAEASRKQRAAENRDHAEEILPMPAEVATRIRDGADMALLEESRRSSPTDRYDSTSSTINKIAFMENVRISEK